MSKGAELRNRVLDAVLGVAPYVAPATVYVALFVVAPGRAGVGGSEPGGGGYVRVAVANGAATWTAAAGGLARNVVPIVFGVPTGDWGTIEAFGLFDDVTGGAPRYYGTLATPQFVGAGATPVSFAVGAMSFTES